MNIQPIAADIYANDSILCYLVHVLFLLLRGPAWPHSLEEIHQKSCAALWEGTFQNNLQRMELMHDYNLTVAEVAIHYALTPRTVRARLKDRSLSGVRINREWHCSWQDVWGAERGPVPRGKRSEAYKAALLTKKALAANWNISERTVERWIAAGLPTRNVFGSVRIAPVDAEEWTRQDFMAREDAA